LKELGEDSLKELSKINDPDIRNTYWVKLEANGGRRPVAVKDRHQQADSLKLHDGVPEEIKIHFETAKNLYLYSWFVYRFGPVAEYHACISLEYALRLKLNGKKRGLAQLLKHAVSEGWLKDDGFSVWWNRKRQTEYYKQMYKDISKTLGRELEFKEEKFEYVKVLTENLPKIRNNYAHGAPTLGPASYMHLQICAEAINQLFIQKN